MSGKVESRLGISRKDKETLMPALPAMSTFALSSSSLSPEVETPDSLGASSAKQTPRMLDLDDSTVAVDCALESSMSDFWQYDTGVLDSSSLDAFLQQPSSLLFGANESAFIDDMSAGEQGNGTTACTKASYSVSTHADFQGRSLSPLNTPRADSGVELDMLTEERPGPLVDLTALLAEMSPYENQLSKLSGGELHNYPIGDALFFSHRFYTILSDYSHLPCSDSTSQLSTPTMLLALSCFITLIRVYTLIFQYLLGQLSQVLEAHSAHESTSCAYPSMGADIHSYRGLRLSQLQPICLCSGWDPTKKAVSMLLSSLGGAEGWLGLPPDARIIAFSDAEAQGEQKARLKRAGGEKMMLFEEGSMAALTNGRLFKTLRKQAKELRERIEEVEELLKGPTDIAHVLLT